jgi:hypothetical protein
MVNDILGVQMIYPTKTGGQQHYLQTHTQSDVFVRLGSGAQAFWGYTVGNTKAFSIAHGHNTFFDLFFETTAGFDDLSTQDHGLAKTRGYLEDAVDFRNVEITMYLFATVVDANSESDHRARVGGVPSTTTDCRGCGYIGKMNWSTAVISFLKQKTGGTWYTWTSTGNAGTGNIEDKWIGQKFMCYNIDAQGRPQFDGARTKLEYWIDKLNNNVWTKAFEFTDTGSNWGTDEPGSFPTCALNPRSTMTFGGPLVIWGAAGAQQNEPTFGDFSVREIDPGMPPDPSGPPPTGGGEVPPPPVAQVTISKQFTDMFHVAQNAGESCDVTGTITPLPYSELWNVNATTPAAYSNLHVAAGGFIRCGIMHKSASLLNNMLPKEITVIVKKIGTPTGPMNLLVYDVNESTGAGTFKRQFGVNFDVAALVTGQDTTVTFTSANETLRIGGGRGNAYVLSFSTTGSTATNCIAARFAGVDALDGANTCWVTSTNGTAFILDSAKDPPWRIEGYP